MMERGTGQDTQGQAFVPSAARTPGIPEAAFTSQHPLPSTQQSPAQTANQGRKGRLSALRSPPVSPGVPGDRGQFDGALRPWGLAGRGNELTAAVTGAPLASVNLLCPALWTRLLRDCPESWCCKCQPGL